jgi:hypothetical protein
MTTTPWSDLDKMILLQMVEDGEPIKAISKFMGRSQRAVVYKLKKLNKLRKQTQNQINQTDHVEDHEEDHIDDIANTFCYTLGMGIVTGMLLAYGMVVYADILQHNMLLLSQ